MSRQGAQTHNMRRRSENDLAANVNLLEQQHWQQQQYAQQQQMMGHQAQKPGQQGQWTPVSDHSTAHSEQQAYNMQKSMHNAGAKQYFSGNSAIPSGHAGMQAQGSKDAQSSQSSGYVSSNEGPGVWSRNERNNGDCHHPNNDPHSGPVPHGNNLYLNQWDDDAIISSKLLRDPAPMLAPKSKKMSLGSITFTSEQAREYGIFVKDNSFFLRCEKNDPMFNDRLSYQVESMHGISLPKGLPDAHDYWPENALYNYCHRQNPHLQKEMNHSYRRWHDDRCGMSQLYSRLMHLIQGGERR